jgi:type I restriction enzyme, S subunit
MNRQLPRGWASASLSDLGKWLGGGTPSKSVREYWNNGTIPWVSPKDMKRLKIDSSQDQITPTAVAESATNLVPAQSVLMVTRSGILEHSFPVAINTVPVTINQDLKAWTPHVGIDPLYAAYFLKAKAQNVLDVCSKDGTTVSSIDFDRLSAFEVSVAPSAEQKRVISKIEELFSVIEEGERALERVQQLMERYRRSVLKAAVTGKLTRNWRETHKTKADGKALLGRIREARRAAWELVELHKMKAKGIEPTNNKWKQNYREPSASASINLPELPDGWVWSSIGELFRVSVGSTPSRKVAAYWNGHIPWVSSGEVAFCRIERTKETISQSGLANSSLRIHPPGTVLLAMVGEGKTRGQAAILNIEATHNQNAASIAVPATPIPSEYIFWILKYHYEAVRRTSQGGNQPALNSELVRRIPIPVPPLEEMVEICQRIEYEVSTISRVEIALKEQARLIVAQRQSILRTAFRGLLVQQDPNEESAQELLKRIDVARQTPMVKARTAAKRKKIRHER